MPPGLQRGQTTKIQGLLLESLQDRILQTFGNQTKPQVLLPGELAGLRSAIAKWPRRNARCARMDKPAADKQKLLICIPDGGGGSGRHDPTSKSEAHTWCTVGATEELRRTG